MSDNARRAFQRAVHESPNKPRRQEDGSPKPISHEEAIAQHRSGSGEEYEEAQRIEPIPTPKEYKR